MNDERWRLLEAAFAQIQPKDDAERQKLEAMMVRMRATTETTAREIESIQAEAAARDAEFERLRRETTARGEVTEGKRRAFLDGLEAQAELIERIARLSRSAG